MKRIAFYFDFVSPYSWLALEQADGFAREHGFIWEPVPVVYAALLDAHDLVGPGEVPAKRAYTFRDVARCAHRLGLRFVGPPAHPFRSLEALRTIVLFREDPAVMRLARTLASACWSEGKALDDPGVLVSGVASCGLDARDLSRRIAKPEVKLALRAMTDEAIAQGVFGVPSFVLRGEIFWGHDRMHHLADALRGATPSAVGDAAARMISRPGQVRRKNAPQSDGSA